LIKKREHQGDREFDGGELHASRLPSDLFVLAGLDDGRVQVKIMGHHRRSENADGDVEHLRILDDLKLRKESAENAGMLGLEKMISARNTADVRIRVTTSAFDVAKSLFWRYITASTSSAVMQTPQISGILNSRSARSPTDHLREIARRKCHSHNSHSMIAIGRE